MNFWRELLSDDIRIVSNQLFLSDLAPLIQFGLWAIILVVPLSGIFRNDILTALTYVLFLASSACILLFAIPGWSNQWSDWRFHFIVLGLISIISFLRWFLPYWRRLRREALQRRLRSRTEVKEF